MCIRDRKYTEYRNKHDVHCCDKPAFSNGRILYADLLQIRCDTQQNTADDASGQCLFPGSGFFLRSPAGFLRPDKNLSLIHI